MTVICETSVKMKFWFRQTTVQKWIKQATLIMQLVTLPIVCGVCQPLQVGKPPCIPTHDSNRKLAQASCNAAATLRTYRGQVLSREPFRHHRGFPFGSVRVGLPADRSVKAISSHETCMSRHIISIAFPRAPSRAFLWRERERVHSVHKTATSSLQTLQTRQCT